MHLDVEHFDGKPHGTTKGREGKKYAGCRDSLDVSEG